MGMYDYVEYEADCPDCGESLSDFQSKDAECTLSTIHPNKVLQFYTSCDNCYRWIYFDVIARHVEVVMRTEDES